MTSPLFSIFIPAYNRGQVIARALDSITAQSCSSWEIIVVDDGSTDATDDVVARWSKVNGISVRYIYQANGGKHVAHNRGVSAAKGELFMVLDSDDRLTPGALGILAKAWLSLSPEQRLTCAGVEGLCVTSEGRLHGTAYPRDIWDGNYLELRGLQGICGEKRSALRVDVLRQYPYPVFAGETHVRPSYIWKQIAHRYSLRCVNQPVQIVDFAKNGLTATSSRRRLRNVKGLLAYWRDDVCFHQCFLSTSERVRHYAEFIRYGLHAGCALNEQWREVPRRLLWLRALPRGVANYLGDLLKKYHHR
ncbi:glycosyltransferase family 2 protein [Ectothiorhodospira haloalkaliphila]|uniref:glycosyltransferase family 2 protein n=1 Tax=Ectothiorhodospira haloalkaliphila TaxID=421628 RepID=UPI000A054F39|nr:glycosyltransferase family A protein [Ectothiorhodospira haloalkaliphila]